MQIDIVTVLHPIFHYLLALFSSMFVVTLNVTCKKKKHSGILMYWPWEMTLLPIFSGFTRVQKPCMYLLILVAKGIREHLAITQNSHFLSPRPNHTI